MSLTPQRKAGQPGHTSNGVRKPLEVPEVMFEASLRARALCQSVSSKSPLLLGSENETRKFLGGAKDNSVSPARGQRFTLQANRWFFFTYLASLIFGYLRPPWFCWFEIFIMMKNFKLKMCLTLKLTQSFQKFLTENFLLMATVAPKTVIRPMPTTPPAEW